MVWATRIRSQTVLLRSVLRSRRQNLISTEKLQERLAKLAGGVAVVRVGAATETEMKEAKLRMEDALQLPEQQWKRGIIAGGGSAYIHASKEVAKLAAELEEMRGLVQTSSESTGNSAVPHCSKRWP